MRIALFGGTFDPVHMGHLLLAESARTFYHLDRVIFLPAGIPPHKLQARASTQDRLRMLRAAVSANPGFEVSDWEIRQKRVVYSFETLAHFQKRFPWQTLFFIVGTDMLKTLPQWRQGTTLLRRARFLAAERPDIPWSKVPAAVRRRAQQIPWPAVPFASHEIRTLVKKHRSIRYQVPRAVEQYIQKHRLYQ